MSLSRETLQSQWAALSARIMFSCTSTVIQVRYNKHGCSVELPQPVRTTAQQAKSCIALITKHTWQIQTVQSWRTSMKRWCVQKLQTIFKSAMLVHGVCCVMQLAEKP